MLWNKGGSAKSMIVPLFSQTSKSILGGKQWVYGKITSNTIPKLNAKQGVQELQQFSKH